jgi:type I restriction enzyme S subunit
MSKWDFLTLEEAGVQLLDCVHKTPAAQETGLPYVAIPQLHKGEIELSDARRISVGDFEEWTKKANPQPFDMVLSRRCNPGETALVRPGMRFALGQNLVLLRADGMRVRPTFLRWMVRSPYWWKEINKFLNVGAVFDSLRCADVPKFSLPTPPLHQQDAISLLLGALDDKIALNHQMNNTLEAMGRAIFQDWFVDFGPVRSKAEGLPLSGPAQSVAGFFPTGFDDDDRPSGWSVSTLTKLTSKIGSGATPRGGKEVYVDEGTNFIRSQNVYDYEFVWDGLAKINADDADRLRNVAVEVDDVLINITGDSILRTCVVDPNVLPARVNQHVAIVRAANGIPPRFLHLYLALPSTKAYLLGNDAGGSRAAVTKGHLELLPVLLPPQSLLDGFKSLTEPWFARVSKNSSENRTLADLRDLFLPKLMSGEIRLKDAERKIEEAL